MKKVIIILFLIGYNCFSQTLQPTEHKIMYDSVMTELDQHPDFQQKNFTLGWHWYRGYKMSDALNMNQIHLSIDQTKQYTEIAKNANMILNVGYIGHHWLLNGWSIAYNIAFQYEPTYKVDLSKPETSFVPRQYDTTRYAFGFGTVKGIIDTASGSDNYDRLQLYQSDTNVVNKIVLADPWVSDGVKMRIERNTALQIAQ